MLRKYSWPDKEINIKLWLPRMRERSLKPIRDWLTHNRPRTRELQLNILFNKSRPPTRKKQACLQRSTTWTWESKISMMSIKDYSQIPRITWQLRRIHWWVHQIKIVFFRVNRGFWWESKNSKIWLLSWRINRLLLSSLSSNSYLYRRSKKCHSLMSKLRN